MFPKKTIFILLLLTLVLISGCLSPQKSAHLSANNQLVIARNIALFQKDISVSLSQPYTISKISLPKTIVPETIVLKPNSSVLVSSSFSKTEEPTKSNINKEAIVLFNNQEYKGIVLNSNPLILKTDKGIIEFKKYDAIHFLNAEFKQNPTLSFTLFSKNPKKDIVFLSYLFSGLSWEPSYSLFIDKDRALFSSFFEITNQTDQDFENISLALSTSSFSLSPIETPIYRAKIEDTASSGNSTYIEQNLLSQHLFSLTENYSLYKNSVLKIPFFSKDIAFEKEFFFKADSYSENKGNASLKYILKNTKSNNLGMSLPSGKITIYEKTNNSFVPIFQTNIKDTAKDRDLEILAGKVFDIYVKSKVISHKEKPEAKENCTYKTIEAEIKNSKDKDISFSFLLSIPPNTEILKSPPFVYENAGLIKSKLNIPSQSSKKITYSLKTCYPTYR